MSTVVTPSSGKAVREDAAFEVFAKRLADMGLWRAVVALPVTALKRQLTPSSQTAKSQNRCQFGLSVFWTQVGLLARRRHIRATAVCHFHRHADGLSKRRVRVDGLADIDRICAHLNRQRDLANHVAGVGPTMPLLRILPWPCFRRIIKQQFGDTFVAAADNGAAGGGLWKHDLYVTNSDAMMRFPYKTGDTQITAPGLKVADLPAGPINHHWTKNLIASRDGSKLYATVGSNSNVAENGMENEVKRAAILEIDPASSRSRLFASGLRNPNGMGWQPQSGALWTAVNERDEIGSDLVPDYMTSVKDGALYGWPHSYYAQHVDTRVKPPRPDMVAKAIVPDYALGPHTASLGLTFYEGKLLPQRYAGGAFIGQHGSWNRKPRSGYKVIFVPFANGQPARMPEDVLTGFLSKDGDALGRPVGAAVGGKGALLVADDVGNIIWRVTPVK